VYIFRYGTFALVHGGGSVQIRLKNNSKGHIPTGDTAYWTLKSDTGGFLRPPRTEY
jgi:hypothetical protein